MTEQSSPKDIVTNQRDKRVRSLEALRTRHEREHTGLYFIDGVRPFVQASQFNAEFKLIVVCPRHLTNPLAQALVERHRSHGVPILEVSESVLRAISYAPDPQGVGAVLRQKWLPLEKVKLNGKLCWLGVEHIQSAGNLGTILRTAEAVGAAGLLLIGDSVDPYDQAVVRASMGALFSQRFVRTTVSELLDWNRERKWMIIGASPSGAQDYQEFRYSAPTILLIGNERKGLSPDLHGICNFTVRIPMVKHTDSLNVAMATGILLYEVFNQRRALSRSSPQTEGIE